MAGRSGMRVHGVVVGVLLAWLCAAGPAKASAGQEAHRAPLRLGFILSATGPSTTAGTFVASGVVQGAGSSAVEDLSVIPIAGEDRGRLTGTQRFTTAEGSIVTRFRGFAYAISTPHQWGEGRVRIVGATGTYAGLRGRGRFEIVVDNETNQLIGTEHLRVVLPV
jgi:hypothetical protein